MASKKTWKQRALAEQATSSELRVQLNEMTELMNFHRSKHAELTAGPVMTPQAKADTEAAFKRGEEFALSTRPDVLRSAERGVDRAFTRFYGEVQAVFTSASASLVQPVEASGGKAGVPEEADNVDSECRCDSTVGLCRVHDVGH